MDPVIDRSAEEAYRKDGYVLVENLLEERELAALEEIVPALSRRLLEEPDENEHLFEKDGEGQILALRCIHNLLEQDPGRDFLPVTRRTQTGIMVRVPHSSGMLEGKYTLETTFPPEDHRSHRPHQWLVDGLKKLEHLRFLHEGRGMTIGQAAIKWLLADPMVITVLPNIYDEEQLLEFAAAPEKRDLTPEDLAKVTELYDHNFYLPVRQAGLEPEQPATEAEQEQAAPAR